MSLFWKWTFLDELKLSQLDENQNKVCHEKNRTGSLSYNRFSFYLNNTRLDSVKQWHPYTKNVVLQAHISCQGAEIYAKMLRNWN